MTRALLGGFAGAYRNIAANLYGQAVSIGAQLALIPIMLYSWGQAGFGQWALLSAVPALLVYSDFGFGVVAGNEVGLAEARGDYRKAATALRTGMVFTRAASLIAFVVMGIASASYVLLTATELDVVTVGLTTAFLTAASAVTLSNGFYTSVMRGLGEWSRITTLNNHCRVVEAVSTALTALASKELWPAALAVLLSRSLNVHLSRRAARGHTSAIEEGHFSKDVLKSWIKPSLTFATLPLTQGLLLNAPIVILGHLAGTSAVAQFVAVRTYCRVPLQAANIIGTALAGPALRETAKVGAHHVAPRITKVSLITTLGAFAMAAVMLVASAAIFRIWTNNQLSPPASLVAALLCCSIASASWNVGSNYLAAVNLHKNIYLVYLVSCLAMIATSHAFLKNALEISFAILVTELVMATCIYAHLRMLQRDRISARD